MEPEGNRWSKPHVSTPSLSGWLELRKSLQNGLILVDADAPDFSTLCQLISKELIDKGLCNNEVSDKLVELWQKKHRHQFEGKRQAEGKLTTVIKELLVQKLESKAEKSGKLQIPSAEGRGAGSRRGSIYLDGENESRLQHQQSRIDPGKVNVALQKKISAQSEAAVILAGAVGFQDKPLAIFVKMKSALHLTDLPEVDLPTRFFFFYTGPSAVLDLHEYPDEQLYTNIGTSLAVAFTDKDFSSDVLNASCAEDVKLALDEYMTHLKILPKDWPDEAKIDPPNSKVRKKINDEMEEEIDEDRRMREASGLVRSKRLFGGLLNDIKRKKPFYISDLLHGLHPQCLSSFLFLYFACLAPIVAFGGLLGEATENRIATIESLVSGLITGVLFGLFSGQPLILLGSTGPVYVFEKILYEMCKDQNWDYLNLRLWIGLWVAAILLLIVAVDGSSYVCYITRFTEELFATLIAFIFIFNACKNILKIGQDVQFAPSTFSVDCGCQISGDTIWHNLTSKSECIGVLYNGTLVGKDCDYQSNVFLMSLLLFLGAFFISITLKNFRSTGYLPGRVRNFLSDFAVIIAILVMSSLDYLAEVETPKLVVPDSFKPTWDEREWLVTHGLIFKEHVFTNPWWVDAFLAPVLAMLATILIFMDQQITAVIVNRKEFLLHKGGGYHLDLLVLAVIITICSIFGLPWFVAATVLSINHIQSLRKESESSAPGEKPQFLGIREQRVTNVMIGVAIGLSTLITPVLALIPMPVLFGVFLFMGVSSLKGLQFFERLQLLFIPKKYQPDYVFLKYVPLNRVHLFTFIQLGNLILLWVIKSHPTTSIAFPVMLVVICAIRKFMECIFTKRELRLLDDLLPESDKNLRKGGRQAMIKQLSKKIAGGGKHHWSDADDDIAVVAANKNEAAILREKKAKAALRERALDLGLEVEHLSFKEVADKKRSNLLEASSTTTTSRRRSSDATFIYPSGYPNKFRMKKKSKILTKVFSAKMRQIFCTLPLAICQIFLAIRNLLGHPVVCIEACLAHVLNNHSSSSINTLNPKSGAPYTSSTRIMMPMCR